MNYKGGDAVIGVSAVMNRIVKRGLIVSAVLAGIPVFLIMVFVVWFECYVYWTANSKFDGRGGGGESISTFVALNEGPIPFFSSKHCDWNAPSMGSPDCKRLYRINRGVCRWWFGERCQAYAVTGQFIRHSDDLGTLLHATIDPCSYYGEMRKKGGSGLWCRSERKDEVTEQRRSIVLVFKQDARTESVRIRIDFPEGFTTSSRERIRNERQKKEE